MSSSNIIRTTALDSGASYQSSVISTDGDELMNDEGLVSNVGSTLNSNSGSINAFYYSSKSDNNAVSSLPTLSTKPSNIEENRQRDEIAAYMRERISASVYEKTGFDLRQVLDARPIVVNSQAYSLPTSSGAGSSTGLTSDMSAVDNDELVSRFAKLQKEHKRQLQQLQDQHSLLSSQLDPSLLSANSSIFSVDKSASGNVEGGAGMTQEYHDELKRQQAAQAQVAQLQQVKLLQAQLKQLQQLQLQSLKDASNNRQRNPSNNSGTISQSPSSKGSPRGRTATSSEGAIDQSGGAEDNLADDESALSQPKLGGSAGAAFNNRGGRMKGVSATRRSRSKSAPKGSPRNSNTNINLPPPSGASPYSIPLSLDGDGGGPIKRGNSGGGLSSQQQQEGYVSYASSTEFAPSDTERLNSYKQQTFIGGASSFIAPYTTTVDSSDADLSSDDPSNSQEGIKKRNLARMNPTSTETTRKKTHQSKQSSAPSRALTVAQQKEFLSQQASQPLPPRPKTQNGQISVRREWSTVVEQGDAKESSPYALKPQLKALVGDRDVSAPLYHMSSMSAMSMSSSSQHAPQHSGHVIDAETDSQTMQSITTTAIVVPMTPQSNQLILSTVGGQSKQSQSTPVMAQQRHDVHQESEPTPKNDGDIFMTIGSNARRTVEQSLAPPPGMVQIPGAQPGIFHKDLSVKPADPPSRPSSRSSERQPILMSSLPPALQGRVRYSLNAQLSAEEVLYARQQLEEYARMALQSKSRATSPNEITAREFIEKGFSTSDLNENIYGHTSNLMYQTHGDHLSKDSSQTDHNLSKTAAAAADDVFVEASEIFTETIKHTASQSLNNPGPGISFLTSNINKSGSGAEGSFTAVPESVLSGGESKFSYTAGSDGVFTLNDGNSGDFPSRSPQRSPHRTQSPLKGGLSKAGFSSMQSSIIMNAMPIGVYSTTESRSRPSLSFGKASRKAWGKVSSPNSSILPIKRVGANGRLDAFASVLLESNGGKFLTHDAEEAFGHLLQPHPSLLSVGSSQDDDEEEEEEEDIHKNQFATTITKTGQMIRSPNLQIELEAAVRAAAVTATANNNGVLPDGFIESVEKKFLDDKKQLKIERKALLAKHRAAAADKAIAEALAQQQLQSTNISIENVSQSRSNLAGPKRPSHVPHLSSLGANNGSSGASIGSSTGTPASRTTQSTKRSLDPSDPDYHYDFNSSLRSDGPFMQTSKTLTSRRPNTTGHPLLSGASATISARQYNPRTGGVSEVNKPNAQMQALLMSAKRGREGILSSSLGGGGFAASRALRTQGDRLSQTNEQPPAIKEAWGSTGMSQPIISIQDSISLQRGLAAEGRDTVMHSATTKTPRSQAGVRGQFREKMGADPNIAAGPSSYPNAGNQALIASKKRAPRVGGFDQMSGRPPMLEEINGPLQPAPNKYTMKSMGDLKSMRDLPMNVGFGYGLRSMDKEEKLRNNDTGQVLAYDITLADHQTLPISPKLTIQSRAAWDTAENAAKAKQAMLDVAMKSTRLDYDSAIAAAAFTTTASFFESEQKNESSTPKIELMLPSSSMSGTPVRNNELLEKKIDDEDELIALQRLKKDNKISTGSPVQNVGALTTTDILRAAQFELLLAERNGDFTSAMDAFFSSISKPAIQTPVILKTEVKKAPWQIALANGNAQLPITPRSLGGDQLIDASLVLSPTGSLFNTAATPNTIRRELNNEIDRSGFVLSPGMEASIESQVLSPLFNNSISGGNEESPRSTNSPSSGEGSPRKRFVRPGAAGTNASSRQRRLSEGKKGEGGQGGEMNSETSHSHLERQKQEQEQKEPAQISDDLGFHFHRFDPETEDARRGLDGDNFDASTINSSSRPGTSAAYPYFTSDGGYAFAAGPMPNAMPSSRSGLRVPENIPKAEELLMTADTVASSTANYSHVNAGSIYSTPPDTASLGHENDISSWKERAEASLKSSSGMNPLLATLLSKVEPSEIANVYKSLSAASPSQNHYEPSVGEPYLSIRLNLNNIASEAVQVGDDDTSEFIYFSVCEVENTPFGFKTRQSTSVRNEFALQLFHEDSQNGKEDSAYNRRRLFQSVAVAPSPSFSSSEMSVHWPELSMSLKALSGEFDLIFEVWAARKGGQSQSTLRSSETIPGQRLLYHTNAISLSDLKNAAMSDDGSKMVHFSLVKGISAIEYNDPELSVASITTHKAPSFGDYTNAGLRVNAVVAVDYSAGNSIRRLLLGAEVADSFEVQRVMTRKTAIKSARRSAHRSAKERRESTNANSKVDDIVSLEVPLPLQAPTLLLNLPLIDIDDGSLHDAAGCTHPEAIEMLAAASSLREKRLAIKNVSSDSKISTIQKQVIEKDDNQILIPPTTPMENLLLVASGKHTRSKEVIQSISIDELDKLLLTASGHGNFESTDTIKDEIRSELVINTHTEDSLGGVELDPYAIALAVLHEAIAPLLSLSKAQEKHKAAAQTLQAGFDLTSSLTLSPPGSAEGSTVLGGEIEGGVSKRHKIFEGRSNPIQTFGFGATLRSNVYLKERAALSSSLDIAAITKHYDDSSKEEEEDGDDAEISATRVPIKTYNIQSSHLSTASVAASAAIEAFVKERNIERSAAVRGEHIITHQQSSSSTADVYWDEAMAFLFPLTDPAEFEADPSSHSSAELLEAYCRSSRMVKPALFRHFAPAIERALFYSEVGGTFSQENQHYTVLFILTAGGPDDIAEATEALLEASLYPVSIVVIGLTPQSDDEIADAALLRLEGEIATAKNTQNRIEQKQKDMSEDIESKNADTAAAHAAISEAYTNEPPPLASIRQLCERLSQLQASEVTPIRGHVEFVSLSLKSLKDAAIASIASASLNGETKTKTQTPELFAVRSALTKSVQRAVSKAVSFIPEHVVEFCQLRNVVPFHMPTFPASSQSLKESDEDEEFQSFGDFRDEENDDDDDDDNDEIDRAVAANTAAAARAGSIDPSTLSSESIGERPSRSRGSDRPRTVTFAGNGEGMGGLDDSDTKPPGSFESPIKAGGEFLIPPLGVASPLLSPTALSLGTIDLVRNVDISGRTFEQDDLMVQKVLAAQVLDQQKFLEEQSAKGLSTEELQLQFLQFLASQQEDLMMQAKALGLKLNLQMSPESRKGKNRKQSRGSNGDSDGGESSDEQSHTDDQNDANVSLRGRSSSSWKKASPTRAPVVPGIVPQGLLPPRARSRERKISPTRRHHVSDSSDDPASSADDTNGVSRSLRRKRKTQTPRLGEVTSEYLLGKMERDKANLRPDTPHTTALIDAEKSVPADVVDKNARAAVALAIVLKKKGEEMRRPSRSQSPKSKRGTRKQDQQDQQFIGASTDSTINEGHNEHHEHHHHHHHHHHHQQQQQQQQPEPEQKKKHDESNDLHSDLHNDLQLSMISTDHHPIDGRRSPPLHSFSGLMQTPSSHAPSSTVVSPTAEHFSFKTSTTSTFNAYDAYLERNAKRGDQNIHEFDLDDLKSDGETDDVKKNREEREMLEQITRNVIKRIKTRDQQMEDMKRIADEDSKKFVEWETPQGRQFARRRMRSALAKKIERERKQKAKAALGKKHHHHDDDSD